MEERRGLIDILLYLLIIALFALFGSGARLLYRWEERPISWARVVGTLMSSVFAAWVVAGAMRAYFMEYPSLIGPVLGAASWGGAEFMDRLARGVERSLRERIAPPKDDAP